MNPFKVFIVLLTFVAIASHDNKGQFLRSLQGGIDCTNGVWAPDDQCATLVADCIQYCNAQNCVIDPNSCDLSIGWCQLYCV